MSMRRRSLPVTQMDHLERFIRAGKPLVVLRTSAAAFQTRQDPQAGYVVWDRFDQEVLGCNYQGYNPKSRETGCDVWIVPEAADHPILARRRSPSSTVPRGSIGSARWPIRRAYCWGSLVHGRSRRTRGLDEHLRRRPGVLHDAWSSGRFRERGVSTSVAECHSLGGPV